MTDPLLGDPWITPDRVGLLTDLYQLTMAEAYLAEGMTDDAVFSLFFRRLPARRGFVLACGLGSVLDHLEALRFPPPAVDYLRSLERFSERFLDQLAALRFTGDVYALPEGTPAFPDEPLLEVVAPIAEAQIVETLCMNQVHHQSVVASKAARVVEAAGGRAVVDFGLRRMHGSDAGLKAARAFHVAGLDATSNVLAGAVYGVPVAGTMAHSYVQAHDDETEAFRRFREVHPGSVLLVDTYDTLRGVERVIELARELGDDLDVRGIRLDSGDLGALAKQARARLDEAGLEHLDIFASGGLDEDVIARLLDDGAPIDGFGVGTGLGVSQDAPALDLAYKLVAYGGRGRLKTSTGKETLPGRKQVFRREEGGRARGDVIGRADETLDGRPLLVQVMADGRRLPAGEVDLDEARRRARHEIDRLPPELRLGEVADEDRYPVEVSSALERHRSEVVERVAG